MKNETTILDIINNLDISFEILNYLGNKDISRLSSITKNLHKLSSNFKIRITLHYIEKYIDKISFGVIDLFGHNVYNFQIGSRVYGYDLNHKYVYNNYVVVNTERKAVYLKQTNNAGHIISDKIFTALPFIFDKKYRWIFPNNAKNKWCLDYNNVIEIKPGILLHNNNNSKAYIIDSNKMYKSLVNQMKIKGTSDFY